MAVAAMVRVSGGGSKEDLFLNCEM